MEDLKKLHFECDCHSDEHRISIAFDIEDKQAYLSTFLPRLGFFKRLYHGARYILGYASKYGQFEETILSDEKLTELQKILKQYKAYSSGGSAGKIRQALDDIDAGKRNPAYSSKTGGSKKNLLDTMGKKNGSAKS